MSDAFDTAHRSASSPIEFAATQSALAAAIAAHYVFPDVGRRAAVELGARRLSPGSSPDGPEAAELLTGWARQATGDQHLRVLHHPNGAPDADEAKAEFRTAFRTRAHTESFGVARAEVGSDGLATIELTNFFDAVVAGDAISEAMRALAGCRGLIVDLRRNGGGEPGSVALLCSYVFEGDPERTHLNNLVYPDGRVEQWWTLPYVPGPRLGPNLPVCVLTAARTFSAAEEFAYDLQALGRAVVIGERTRGGAHTVEQYRLNEHVTALIPNARAVNPVTGTNWERVGVVPDLPCAADDAPALARAHLARLTRDGRPG